jgi:hypothetical protein
MVVLCSSKHYLSNFLTIWYKLSSLWLLMSVETTLSFSDLYLFCNIQHCLHHHSFHSFISWWVYLSSYSWVFQFQFPFYFLIIFILIQIILNDATFIFRLGILKLQKTRLILVTMPVM